MLYSYLRGLINLYIGKLFMEIGENILLTNVPQNILQTYRIV